MRGKETLVGYDENPTLLDDGASSSSVSTSLAQNRLPRRAPHRGPAEDRARGRAVGLIESVSLAADLCELHLARTNKGKRGGRTASESLRNAQGGLRNPGDGRTCVNKELRP